MSLFDRCGAQLRDSKCGRMAGHYPADQHYDYLTGKRWDGRTLHCHWCNHDFGVHIKTAQVRWVDNEPVIADSPRHFTCPKCHKQTAAYVEDE